MKTIRQLKAELRDKKEVLKTIDMGSPEYFVRWERIKELILEINERQKKK